MLADQLDRLVRLGVSGQFELSRFKRHPAVMCRASATGKWLEAVVLLAPMRERRTYASDPLDLRPESVRSKPSRVKLRELLYLRVLGEEF
jgi:hypothetical protein